MIHYQKQSTQCLVHYKYLKGILKEEPTMLNPKVKELYTEDTIKVLQELSDIMEQDDIKTYLYLERNYFGIKCPALIYTNNRKNNNMVREMYYKLTDKLGEENREILCGMNVFTTDEIEEGAVPLWVK
jgi:hypothetical protein